MKQLARKHLTPRYHVRLGQKRTTVSLDRTLTELLALKLGEQPYSDQSHTVIRHWLQQRLDADNDPGRYLVSQWLQSEVMHYLVDKKLSNRYTQWLLQEED